MESKNREWYDVKVRAVLWLEADDDNDIVVLYRMVRWTRDGVELVSKERHGRLIR